jgi:hypothetical protein
MQFIRFSRDGSHRDNFGDFVSCPVTGVGFFLGHIFFNPYAYLAFGFLGGGGGPMILYKNTSEVGL